MCQSSRCSPKVGRHKAVCQDGRWAPKGVDLGSVPHQLEEGKSASKDARSRRGWIVMSHVGWGGEQTTIYKGV